MDNDGHVNEQGRAVERLDVEDDNNRQLRIQSVLEKMNSTPANYKSSTPPSFDFGNRTTYPTNPPTELLSRVQAFLPQLEASNTLLAQRVQSDPKSVDIENVGNGEGQYIEMNLGLGVFQDRAFSKPHSTQDEDAEMFNSSSDTCSISDGSDDVDTDSSSEIITSFLPARPIKPLPKRKTATHPQIMILEDRPST